MVETSTNLIGDITVVAMSGRLHLGNSLTYVENAINRLIDGGTRKLVLDLVRLDYIDSSGLGMLIGCNGRMDQHGGKMRVAGAQGAVSKVFAVVHAERILNVDADVETACRQLSAGSAAGTAATTPY
ncbi:MAG TPA: STAS domain-containing protein [Bryobacteraceae bacterium]|nr:STAS domain-containing protein [Bryobacteraceae bacterium]